MLGNSAETIFNGADLAQSECAIVVSFNYRLGPLGFLPLNGVTAASGNERENTSKGNGGMNGINDQIIALKWVQDNIIFFGGNPKQVTIFGQSAGGTSVCILLASPRARGLFARAIIESGPCIGPWGPGSLEYGNKVSQAFMRQYNATTLEELQALPASISW